MEDISFEDAVKTTNTRSSSKRPIPNKKSNKKSNKEGLDVGKLGDDNDNDETCIFGLSGEIIRNVELKKLLLLFIILVIVHSSIYMSRVLTPIDGATMGMAITSKGSLIQITSVMSMFAAMNFLVNTTFL